MKFYVAGKFEDHEKVSRVINALVERGHTVSYDWTVHAQASPERIAEPDYRVECARLDMQGVRDCEALFLLGDNPKLAGTWVEMGAAIALGKKVFVAAPVSNCVFLELVNVFPSIDDALNHIGEA